MRAVDVAVGNTPVVELGRRLVPEGSARVFVKLEYFSPSGSYKDRMARSMIEGAERRGALKPGMSVVEYTGGSTGIAIAFVCASKVGPAFAGALTQWGMWVNVLADVPGHQGYPCVIVTNDAVALEKRSMMRAFGAKLEVLTSQVSGRHTTHSTQHVDLALPKGGVLTPDLLPRMMQRAQVWKGRARRIPRTDAALQEIASKDSNFYYTNQMHNRDMLDGYAVLGDELAKQVGRIDAFCACTGTSGKVRHHQGRWTEPRRDAGGRGARPRQALPASASGGAGAHYVSGAHWGPCWVAHCGGCGGVWVDVEQCVVIAQIGVAPGFVPPLFDRSLVSECRAVDEQEGRAMVRRLAQVCAQSSCSLVHSVAARGPLCG